MKTLIAALTLGLATGLSHAGCPVNLDGNYLLSARKTTMDRGLTNITYVIALATISDGKLHYTKMFKADANTGKPALETVHEDVAVYYDSATCSGYLEDISNPHYFVVSESGKLIKGIAGTEPGSSLSLASELELVKQ